MLLLYRYYSEYFDVVVSSQMGAECPGPLDDTTQALFETFTVFLVLGFYVGEYDCRKRPLKSKQVDVTLDPLS